MIFEEAVDIIKYWYDKNHHNTTDQSSFAVGDDEDGADYVSIKLNILWSPNLPNNIVDWRKSVMDARIMVASTKTCGNSFWLNYTKRHGHHWFRNGLDTDSDRDMYYYYCTWNTQNN